MSRYLSEKWFEEQPSRLDGEPQVIIQQTVEATPDGDITYVIEANENELAYRLGSAENPDVMLVTDYETAVAMHRDALTPTEAVLSGRVKVSGDFTRLIEMSQVPVARATGGVSY